MALFNLCFSQRVGSGNVQKESDYRSREVYWDIVKSLLIFLVILGHVIQVFGVQYAHLLVVWHFCSYANN